MDMYQIIEAIKRGMNPNAAIQAALGGSGGPDGAATDPANPQPQPQPQPQPDPNAAPQGAKTALTNPADPAATPKVQQSPPDLANMYLELMRKSENARALDSNLSLIAAGFSKYPENRAALIKRAGGAGDQAMSLTPTDLINFQKQEEANRNALIRQKALPALMKQYGMTPAQIEYLNSSGKLDEVIKHHSTRSLGSATDQATGKTILYDPHTGKTITELGGVKPEEGEFQDTPEGRRLVSKRSGEPMGAPLGAIPPTLIKEYEGINAAKAKLGEPPLSPEEFMKLKHPGATTKVEVNVDKNGVQHPKPEEGYNYVRNPDGTVKIDENGRAVTYPIKGSKAEDVKAKGQKEIADAEKAERVKRVNAAFATSNIGEGVNKAFSVADVPGVTGFGSNWARIFNPGGMSKNTFDAAKETIEAGAAFKQLQQMREAAAASGGASGLGQVTEKENRMLASVIASIRWDQPTPEVKKALARLKAAFIVMAAEDVPEAELPGRISDMADRILVEEANKANATKGIKSTIRRVN